MRSGWIVNLIRQSRLEAKIDSKAGTVIMTNPHPSRVSSKICIRVPFFRSLFLGFHCILSLHWSAGPLHNYRFLVSFEK